jgi:hypothetical protein
MLVMCCHFYCGKFFLIFRWFDCILSRVTFSPFNLFLAFVLFKSILRVNHFFYQQFVIILKYELCIDVSVAKHCFFSQDVGAERMRNSVPSLGTSRVTLLRASLLPVCELLEKTGSNFKIGTSVVDELKGL